LVIVLSLSVNKCITNLARGYENPDSPQAQWWEPCIRSDGP
jgi:hypothetical protein